MVNVVRNTAIQLSTVKSHLSEFNGRDIIWILARMYIIKKFFESWYISSWNRKSNTSTKIWEIFRLCNEGRGNPGFTGYPCSVSYVMVNHFQHKRTEVSIRCLKHNSGSGTQPHQVFCIFSLEEALGIISENAIQVVLLALNVAIQVGILHSFLKIFHSIFPIIIISCYCAYPDPIKVGISHTMASDWILSLPTM